MKPKNNTSKLEEAEQKGRINAINEIVVEMYNDGLPLERIAKITKLTYQQVEQIIKNHYNTN